MLVAMASGLEEHCTLLVRCITPEVLLVFENNKTDLTKLSTLYEVCAEAATLDIEGPPAKDFKKAADYKILGNTCFKKREYKEALNKFNTGLENCPQDTDEGQELYNVLLGNRSATLYYLGKYDAVVEDIELLDLYKKHPNWYKIYIRGAKAYQQLKKYVKAAEYYNKAIEDINENYHNNPELQKTVKELYASIEAIQDKPEGSTNKDEIPILEKTNTKYPALSSALSVKENSEFGRFIVANRRIEAGKIIAVERPFVSVVSVENLKKNCHRCLKSTYQFLVCPTCSTVVYCSKYCFEKCKRFHNVECYVLPTLINANVSVNCLLALRMITQQTLEEIRKNQVSETIEKPEKPEDVYKHNDMSNVLKLVNHDKTRKPKEHIHFTLMAVYLLRILKQTSFFDYETNNSILTDVEAYVGSLLLRYLQILQFNAHELSELRNVKTSRNDHFYESHETGAGLYPTLAFFNHSCDPSITRYNVGNVLVLCTIKPIEKDEEVYENYGQLFFLEEREKRQESLMKWYYFQCSCIPCTEDWPLFDDTKSKVPGEFRFKCRCKKKKNRKAELGSYKCPKCSSIPFDMMIVKQEIVVKNVLRERCYPKMLLECGKLINEYCEKLEQPVYYMLPVQQSMRSIFLHYGNKQRGYELYPHDSF